ncbi:aspartate kinase [Acidaminobacterium chupaoyuni]
MKLVHKYGGSSVATPEKITAIAGRIAQLHREGKEMVVVCSAMGKTTNGLIALAAQVSSHPSKREMDALLSTGEIQTVSLMAMALQEQGVDAISMTGFQSGFITNNTHSKAFIKELDLSRVEEELAGGRVVVVAGFQGITEDGNITTLGRGGSDTTAVAIAAKLGCDCEIYTDVNAVYTVDPRLYAPAKALRCISYEEMMEMASLGAGVLETRCVELAKKYGVRLYLGQTLETEKKGTFVMNRQELENFEDMPVTGLSIKDHCAIVSFRPMEYTAENAASIFALISRNHINLDMISQTILDGRIAFCCSCSDAQADELALSPDFFRDGLVLDIQKGYTQLSLVGVGMATHTGVAVKVFETLAALHIPYYQITTSEISISFTIDACHKEQAVAALAEAFSL